MQLPKPQESDTKSIGTRGENVQELNVWCQVLQHEGPLLVSDLNHYKQDIF